VVLVGRPERRDRFQDLDVDGKKLKYLKKNWMGSISRINVVRDKWRVFVKKALNLRVSSNAGNF